MLVRDVAPADALEARACAGRVGARGPYVSCGQMGSTLINGAAAKVMNFDRLGKKVRPSTFRKIKVGSREYPKIMSKNMKFAVTPH